MQHAKSLSLAALAASAVFGLGLFAQESPPANKRPMQNRMQHRGAGMMQGHQEIADAATLIR